MPKARHGTQHDPTQGQQIWQQWLPQATLAAAASLALLCCQSLELSPEWRNVVTLTTGVLLSGAMLAVTLLACQRLEAWWTQRILARTPPWEIVMLEERTALGKSGAPRTSGQLLSQLVARMDAAEELPAIAAAFVAVAKVVHACPDDTVLAALRRHRRAMCRAIGRPRFADATGSMDPGALPLLSVSLLTAGHAASQSAAAQLEVLQATIPQTPLVCGWALPFERVPAGDTFDVTAAAAHWRRQMQLLGSTQLLQHATNAAAPPFVMPEDLQHAAPPCGQLLEVALQAAAAHSQAALQCSAAASSADSAQNRELALDLQEWATQATATALQCAEQLQRHQGNPPLSPQAAHHAAEALQHLVATVQPGAKQQRGLAPKFAALAHNACWAVDAMAAAPPQQIAACIDALAGVLAKRLPVGTATKAMHLAYLAALAAPWAAACRQLPPRTRWNERLRLARALLHAAREAATGSKATGTSPVPLATSNRQQTVQQQAAMLADSAASAMAAVVLEVAALPCRPASQRNKAVIGSTDHRQGSGSGSSHSEADAPGNISRDSPSRPQPPPLLERLAAAGYLADLTWALEHAGSSPVAPSGSEAGSPAARSPPSGLWAAYNALAAVAGWLEGAVQYAECCRQPGVLPSARLQSAVARAAVAMVDTAQRLLASGVVARAGGTSSPSRSTPVSSSRQTLTRWQADSAPCRMAFSGASILGGFLATSSLQLVAAQHGGALAIAHALEIGTQSDAPPAEVQALAGELLPALAALLPMDDRGRAALAAGGARPWEPLSRLLITRLPSWAGLPLQLAAVGDALSGGPTLTARAAAAEAAAASLLEEEAQASGEAHATAEAAAVPCKRKPSAVTGAPLDLGTHVAATGVGMAAPNPMHAVNDKQCPPQQDVQAGHAPATSDKQLTDDDGSAAAEAAVAATCAVDHSIKTGHDTADEAAEAAAAQGSTTHQSTVNDGAAPSAQQQQGPEEAVAAATGSPAVGQTAGVGGKPTEGA